MYDLLLTDKVTKLKPDVKSVDVHPQLSPNDHPVDAYHLEV
jgi:hypothetical protein